MHTQEYYCNGPACTIAATDLRPEQATDITGQNPANSPVLLGADSFADLTGATIDYETNGNFQNSPTVFPLFFRGRMAPIPEIPVTVNGTADYVPLGTTVSGLPDQVQSVALLSQDNTGEWIRFDKSF